MDESEQPIKPATESPTPEVAQLLRLLEIQTAAQREKRSALPKSLQGGTFRYGSIAVIIVFALGSVGLMEWVISQLPKPPTPAAEMPPAAASQPPVKTGSAALAGAKPGSSAH